jgi:Prenyltransferase and squalene oxidase repeat
MKTAIISLLLLGCTFAFAAPVAAPPPAGAPADAPDKKSEVDKAIADALEFLALTQDKNDGSWRSTLISNQRSTAVTSLAIMAFLSAGHVPGEGKYGEVIEKGVRWVLKMQQPNGLIATDNGSFEMYSHGISTLMLAEVCGMTDGKLAEELRPKLEKAVAIILKGQRQGNGPEAGGWRYHVQNIDRPPPSDMSVTGWQIMALRAAKNLGCDVPAEVIDNAVGFIKRCQDKNTGGFCYYPGGNLTVPCTGTGILALELCGKDKHRSPEVLQAGAFLIKDQNLPRWGDGKRFFYYNIYYSSQATFQLGGNYREVFRPKLHEVLLRNQRNNGSWIDPPGDNAVGPQYCTAMGVLALTVEYRFLPIYQRDEESAEANK